MRAIGRRRRGHRVRGLDGIDFVGMDVVEVAPACDVAEITALAAAGIALDHLARDRPDVA